MTGRLLEASSHPKASVRKILVELEAAGWTIHEGGHWGRLYCPCPTPCLKIPISGTPQNAERHARRIRQLAGRCPLAEDDPRRSF